MFLRDFNGSRIIQSAAMFSVQTDACTEGGGVYFNGDFFYVNWSVDMPSFLDEHINVKGFLCIFLAICRWGIHLKNKRFICFSDNKSALSWLNKGTSRNPMAMLICRCLFWFTDSLNCSLVAKCLPGKRNVVADTVSRLHDPNTLGHLYDMLPFLQCEHFNLFSLSRHMSMWLIFYRWLSGGLFGKRDGPTARKGVG